MSHITPPKNLRVLRSSVLQRFSWQLVTQCFSIRGPHSLRSAIVGLICDARDAGMQVVYEGIRLTPEEIVDAARKEKAHVIGLSVLSGSHLPLVEDVVERMKRAGLDVPVIVGGIIPPEDAAELERAGVAAVYTPKDFELNRIMSDVVRIVERTKGVTNA